MGWLRNLFTPATDIEVVSLPYKRTGVGEREVSTFGGGSMTCVEGKAHHIRIFGRARAHGSFVILVDGQNELLLQRVSSTSLRVQVTKDGVVSTDRIIRLGFDRPVQIGDASGRPMTLRRCRPQRDLLALFARADA